MIVETEYKNCEAVVLENNYLKVVVLPSLGGKIASFYTKEKAYELAFQHKESAYKRPKVYDDFASFDASGLDDAFPTITEEFVKIGSKEVRYPDHGEVWSAAFTYNIIGEKLQLCYKSDILNYTYKKVMQLEGKTLHIDYDIINEGIDDFPCLWAAHFLVNCHEDMQLILPRGTRSVLNVLDSNYLGTAGKLHSYPKTIDSFGQKYSLDRVFPASAQKAEKFYVYGELQEGLCGIYYPHKDITYMLRFDKHILPYLGFWVTEGGFRGDYNCALEPANGFYDSIEKARQEGNLFILKSRKKLNFTMDIEVI